MTFFHGKLLLKFGRQRKRQTRRGVEKFFEGGHIPPRALPGQEVVTIKTEGCVLTLGPQRCYKYDFLNNWPSPLGDLSTLIFSSIYVTTEIILDISQYTSKNYKETKVLDIFQ